ncbi:polyketide synthase [Fusarium heterosporum]|uniref:Polyketide synthase n=1 Tax=Fusarium heterosporum TaxID=42747 RepID=A0A8H5WMS3_FUSHE|nr:polyketide synthase [Fusarium heterosporum]
MSQTEAGPREPIAVIGSACRFPGSSNSPSKLWDLLREPYDTAKEFDAERLNLERFYHISGDTHGSTDVANKSYLLEEDTRLFDAAFFGISPLEASGMDPQQRILLEATYEAFESAGMTLEQLRGSLTSVHVGVMTSDWANIQARDTETIAKYNATGSANSIMSNRISYVFDLRGPSETIDTACSSSLVALHNATLGLLNGDCDSAVVAGVNLILDPAPYINESKLHMLSPDSRSRMWDKDANGYARGEGAGAVLLKTLSRALKDGDHIEGLIRSTGVNSDGQSPGITMPFAPTQTALIRKTYARAGLDPKKDRPQYFECHGTGTPAGDPVEARAISDAFSGGDLSVENPIYVGSVKTIIGHLEGGAGIAGLIKVLLAIKHRIIPPNMLFNELNPSVAPFYGPLQIPTTAIPWPELPPGVPARASVNSFGFGGTNAHAIIESYDDTICDTTPHEVLGPFILSAKSGDSLMRIVKAYMDRIREDPSLNITTLSSILQSRRTTHRVRAHFSGSSREALLADMADFLDKHAKAAGDNIGHIPKLVNSRERSGILGVFTGQGAQWPAMGRELIQSSPVFRRTLEECEAVLARLPEKDRPQWSLLGELTADDSTSRIAEAVISQPLCTAIQLALMNLLTEAGVRFDAVVGHSSGEIAATYAAGILTLKGAMQISYYRGLHAKLACGDEGTTGGMIAAGLSLMQAREFIARPEFKGRISVAACNAPRTVTLSGDSDAIAQAKVELDKDNIFARQLKVDTAYHSHQMLPCAEPYLKDLLACDIEVKQPQKGQCVWNSSVRGDTQLLRGDLSSLKGQYWVDNMVRTVLFSQAIESSIWHGGPYDLIMEVGPHPALKGPTEQTMKASYGSVPIYTGVLDRKKTADVSFSAAIGITWAQLGPSFVDFSGYRDAFHKTGKAPAVRMIKDLPLYSWDHDKIYWREGRMSRRFRLGRDSSHELLGRRTLDDNEFELRWRNVLKLSEMPWLRGHQVLDEVLLPGASYVSIAIEAGKHLATDAGKVMSLVEVEDIQILRPVVVPDNNAGVETLFTASVIQRTRDMIKTTFTYYVCPDENVGSMLQTCKGHLTVHIKNNHDDSGILPPREQTPPNLASINTEQVYSLFKGIGLDYTGAFKSITGINRCLNYANTTATWQDTSLSDEYMLHPAVLDVAFQTLFIAKAHPASKQITSALLPSHIDRVRIDPTVLIVQSGSGMPSKAEVETWAVSQTATSLRGDLNIYEPESGATFLQVEGLAVNMVGASQATSDRSMFSKTVWGNDASLGITDPERDEAQDAKGMKMAHAVERVAMFYVKRIVDQIPVPERSDFVWYHQRMFEAFENHIRVVAAGEHPIIKAEWLRDDASIFEEINAKYGDEIDIKLLHAVGNHLAEVVRGKAQLLEVMTKDDMLNRFYMEGYASIPTNKFVGDVMKQLTFKHPRAKILEIGAGTGGTSWSILNTIKDAYDSYTYTDISSGFFPNAAEKFSNFAHKMVFKVLNVEDEPTDQGFEEGSYDIIVAALVLHATHDLKRTLSNTRKLLKPGGYLVLLELTGITSVRATFIMGGLEGWWLGADDGRRLTPLVTAVEWDSVLQETGFSGAETVVYDLPDENKHCTSLIVSQAIDDDFLRLREPLSYKSDFQPPTEPVLIIGGKKLWTNKVISEVKKILPRSWQRKLQVVEGIDKVDISQLSPRMDTIVLQDADESVFATTMTKHRLERLQSLLINSKNMLWVTTAGKSHTPRASLIQGITRVVPAELPHLNTQLLGLSTEQSPSAAAGHTVEAFLRMLQIDQASSSHEILWAHEPELEISVDGQANIPRVIPDVDLNDMYNASKRSISKAFNAKDVAVEAVVINGKVVLQSVDMVTDTADCIQIEVHSTLHIPGFNDESLYLVLGKAGSDWVVAMSPTNSSFLVLDSKVVATVSAEYGTPKSLSSLASNILVRSVAAIADTGKSVLFYEADEAFAHLADSVLRKKNIKAQFATSRASAPPGWIHLHSLSSQRSLERRVPRDIGVVVDCSDGLTTHTMALMASAPKNCKGYRLGATLVSSAISNSGVSVGKFIEESINEVQSTPTQIEFISASNLTGVSSTALLSKHFVTDWTNRDTMTLTIKPLDPHTLFKPDRTYFMAGMAGGLGLSICEWMIRNGAKNLVITSRNPKLQDATLQEARRVGATIKVMPMDLTEKESVESVVREIRSSMPPIAGVCNAGMVLKDGFFVDMDVEQLNDTLAAKVLGSEHLDSVFEDFKLDFFICLGSVASVIGNVGQSNYHAANLFMASLIQQRRSRGLAGSIIHIAYVTDVGYVTRQERDRQLDSHFRKVRLMPTSETDVHHAFMEAIRGGKPGSSGGSHEIIMGIEPLDEPVPLDQQPLWMRDPRFGHFAPPTSLHSQREGKVPGSVGNVKQSIEEAESQEEAVVAVTKAFCGKLETMLQLASGSVNIARPIIDIGIDSLVAVEIRTWFLKELGADVPVVKILGGDTVEQVSTLATKKVMARIIENKTSQPQDETKSSSVPSLAAPTTSTQSPASSLPVTPGGSRAPSPPVRIEETTVPLSEQSTVEIATTKDDLKTGPIATTLAFESDNVRPSDIDSNGQQGKLLFACAIPVVDVLTGADVQFEHSIETTLPEFLSEQSMSPAQTRMWFISTHAEDPAAYNMVFRYHVKGPVSITRLRHALSTIAHHHEALRTCFFARLGDGHPMQGILASSPVQLRHVQVEDEDLVDSEMKRLASRHWRLDQGNAFELVLMSRDLEDHEIFFAYHHILMDVVGLGIVLRDLDLAYQLKLLDRNTTSYLDYSTTQLELERTDDFHKRMSFWESEFATLPDTLPLLPMASVTSRPWNTDNHCHHQYRQLQPEQFQRVKQTCQRLGISQFHFHLAVLQILLAKYTGVEDICVGIVDANRSDARFAQTVGYFVNMLPVRAAVPRTATFSNIAKTASRKTLTVLNEAAVPFDRLLTHLKVPRSGGLTPLFQAALNYRMGSIWEMPLGGAKLLLSDVKDAINPFDLSLGVAETPTGCVVELYSLSSLYSQEACSLILESYMRLLDIFSADSGTDIVSVTIHDQVQVDKAIKLGKGPVVKYDWPSTLSHRLQYIISLYPDEVAVKDTLTQATYAELNSRLHRVADILLRQGCTAGSRIAVLCNPSLDFVVSMLAVLHIGAIYVPLDVSLPTSRHASMIKTSQPAILLCHSATTERAHLLSNESGMHLPEVMVDNTNSDDAANIVYTTATTFPDAPAVLLFTSGSTGTPKGIMLTQANFINHLALKADVLSLKREIVLQQSSFGFDMSLIQTFCALANGGRLIIAPYDLRRDPVELPKLVYQEDVTLTIATPSEYLAWLRYGTDSLIKAECWRHACMGGEKVSSQLRDEFGRLGLEQLELTNCYGPTEITAAATFQTIQNGQHSSDLSVGKALPNYSILILDSTGAPQPVGHTGEICIGGSGVALGYLDLVDETNRKFGTTNDEQRLYLTGDKGRLQADGTLLYLGRLDGDTQIKLRGLRVELQDVENAVLEASGGLISGAVVSLRNDTLVAHVTLSVDNSPVDHDVVLDILARVSLPQYFVPASITVLSVFPTTSNGKIDRAEIARLPVSTPTRTSQSAFSPREKMTVREGELRLLWERVLPAVSNHGSIVPSSDFFSLGGNSMLLMKLQAAIRETMTVQVSTRALYQASTLRGMAEAISQLRQEQSVIDAEHDIDWDAETAIPSWLIKQLQQASPSRQPKVPKTGIQVMMTGATGFLGGHLLRSLLASTQVMKIHCIAILADQQDALPHDDKIQYYTGSLLSPTLGLSTDQCDDLADSIDVIIHAGSSGHCLNTYASLRVPNVHSTHFLASMAACNSIPLLFLSSNRVVLLSGDEATPPTSVSRFYPATDGLEGHMMSRWASEVFLEKLVEYVGGSSPKHSPWTVSVHRSSVVVSDQAPNSDALNAILRYSVSMRCVPRLDRVKGFMDLVPLDKVVSELSEWTVRLAQGQSTASIQFKHHSGGIKVPAHKLREHLDDLYDVKFQEVGMREWLDLASEAGMDPLITAYIEGILENDAPMVFPYMGE